MQKRVFQLLVDNTSGVLSRISGLFSRRGYNIDSITAGVTADPRFTRITIVTDGDDEILEQIEKQLAKLVPPEEGLNLCHRLVWHGRRICIARRPQCADCCLNEICKNAKKK